MRLIDLLREDCRGRNIIVEQYGLIHVPNNPSDEMTWGNGKNFVVLKVDLLNAKARFTDMNVADFIRQQQYKIKFYQERNCCGDRSYDFSLWDSGHLEIFHYRCTDIVELEDALAHSLNCTRSKISEIL